MKSSVRLIFLFLILILTDSGFAQNNIDDNLTIHRKLNIGFNFSPDYAYRYLFPKDTAVSPYIIASRNNIEHAKYGYTTGLSLRYTYSSSICFETGLYYSNKGYRTETISLYNNLTSPQFPSEIKFRYNMHYLDIPLKVNFGLSRTKLYYYLSLGFITNLYLFESVRSKYTYDNGNTEYNWSYDKGNFKRIAVSPTAGFGVIYSINEKTKLGIQSQFNYGVIDISKGTVGGYLWNAGINFSLLRVLGK